MSELLLQEVYMEKDSKKNCFRSNYWFGFSIWWLGLIYASVVIFGVALTVYYITIGVYPDLNSTRNPEIPDAMSLLNINGVVFFLIVVPRIFENKFKAFEDKIMSKIQKKDINDT